MCTLARILDEIRDSSPRELRQAYHCYQIFYWIWIGEKCSPRGIRRSGR
jgi:hypothetical protein